MFPQAIHFLSDFVKIFSKKFVVVDFPLVPVTPIVRFWMPRILINSKSVVI